MKYRVILLLAGTGISLFTALSSQAMPLITGGDFGRAHIVMVDSDEDEDEDEDNDNDNDGSWDSGGDDNQDRRVHRARGNCGEDEGSCGTSQRTAPPSTDAPNNGLFTPGSKPQVQVN